MNAIAIANERERVAAHIQRAESAARRARRPRDRVRALVRALLLDELAHYREGGVFPKNRDFPERAMPYFVDAEGTRCAMAHLLELGGAATLVAKIASERNNAFVRELADEPGLLAWLDAAGISVEEAAAIQPGYCWAPGNAICGGGGADSDRTGVIGVAEVSVVPGTQNGRIEAIYGDGGTLKVGDAVQAWVFNGDTRVLAPITDRDYRAAEAGPPLLDQVVSLDNGMLKDAGEHTLSREQLVEAMRGPDTSDCMGRLAAYDDYFTERDCDDGMSGGGCATSSETTSPASVAILVAIVSAIVARRTLRQAAKRA